MKGRDFEDDFHEHGAASIAAALDAARFPWEGETPPFSAYGEEIEAAPESIRATPFVWRSEADIPPRQWLYGRHLLRKFVSLDVAPGGVGKSSIKIGEALAMASGKDIYNKGLPEGPLSAWLYNLEDPADENERRLHATAKRFGITPADVAKRLFVDSGRDQPLVIATDHDGIRIARPVVDALVEEIKARGVDVLIVDPFVSSHRISENDNMAIDAVAKEWARIADVCNCAINLVHHVRKSNGAEITADSARGAVALIGAARSVQVYNRMTADEAERGGIDPDEARFIFRISNDKANLAPPEAADWYRMNNVDLDNGDKVGVACPWQWPNHFAGITEAKLRDVQSAVAGGDYREDSRSPQWAGHVIGSIVGRESNDRKDAHALKAMIREWIENGILAVEKRQTTARQTKAFIVPGPRVVT